jgi:iron(III)-enterobactin esterase
MKSARIRSRLTRLLIGLGLGKLGAGEEVLPIAPTPDLLPREVRVYLPPGGVDGETPLLVALDGQVMEQWRLGEAIAELARFPGARPPLVVAISATAERIDEYGLAHQLDYAGRGRKAAVFQRFVVEQMLPAVRARHGLSARREITGIFGASMGGLSAFDLAWNHPDVFGFAGVFSGSLWWRGDDSDATAQQGSRLVHHMVRETRTPPALRLWFQAGTADETDDRDGNGVIDAIQDTTELIDELQARGFRVGHDVVYHEVAGGEHNQRTWAEAFPVFLRWALSR